MFAASLGSFCRVFTVVWMGSTLRSLLQRWDVVLLRVSKLNYRFMSMAQHVFAKFISVIKFYHWRQNVHMPFNFHNIFTHHTHTQHT